jgi:phosphoglycolate phosphatase-like HAD superfamily hydrolase
LHVCLFDIDGTLIASGGAGKAALEAALAAEYGIPCISDRLTLSGRTDTAILADIFALHELEHSGEAARRLLDTYLSHLPTHLAKCQGLVLPGILELLLQLHERDDVLLGLLTGNIRAGAQIKLSHHGLWDFFAFGGFGDLHLDRDDVAREALEEATRRLTGGVIPGRVWVVGDTPLDIRCARAIGAKAIAVATGWHGVAELNEHKPDLLLEDLGDASPLLRLIGS